MSGLATGFGLALSGARPRLVRPVFLTVAGQSNAVARGTVGQTPAARYSALPSAFIWTGTGFDPYRPGINSGTPEFPSAWGPEAEFACRLDEYHPGRPLYIVKHALSGSALQPNASADWHPASGELFAALAERVSDARAWLALQGATALDELSAWCQGEADMLDDTAAGAHRTNLEALLAAWRQTVSRGLFIIERTRLPGHALGRYGAGYAVRNAQLSVAEAAAASSVIDLDFEENGFTQLHPGPGWVDGRGLRLFSAWKGRYATDFGSIGDTSPDAFAIPPVNGAEVASQTVSATVAPQAFQKRAPVSLDGGEIQIRHPDGSLASDWTTGPAFVEKYQTFQLRQTAASAYEEARTMMVTIGTTSAAWTVTTRSEVLALQAETQAYADCLSAAAAPALASQDIGALDSFILAAKTDGWWDALGSAFLFAIPSSRDAARINLRYPANALAAETGSLVWSATHGFNPNGASDTGLDLQFDPSASRNSIAIAAWYSDLTPSAQHDMRSTAGTGNLFGMMVDSSGNWRFNLHNVNSTRTGLSTAIGFRMAVRSGASEVALYGPAGTQIDASSLASGTPSGTDVRLGKASTTANRPIAAVLLFSRAPSASEAQSVRDALNTLGTAWHWPGAN